VGIPRTGWTKLSTEIHYKSYEYEDGGEWFDTEENGLIQRRMEASVEEGQGPESAIAPYIDGRTGQF
jgi:hypothetical protein